MPLAQIPIEQWLSPKELAGHFGLKEDSAYRWINDGTIQEEYLKRTGRRRYRIHPAAIESLEKIFSEARR